MSKLCCDNHDNMEFDGTDLTECGTAGMGTPVVCCASCPDNVYPEGAVDFYDTEENQV